jgi:hypothetical protein
MPPDEVLQDSLMVYVFRDGEKVVKHPWKSTETFNKIIADIRKDDSELTSIYFSPGEYIVDSEIVIYKVDNIEIIGSLGTKLVFPDGELPEVKLIKEAKAGDKNIFVNNLSFFEKNKNYQGFKEKKSAFILEFNVKSVADKFIETRNPIYLMGHVNNIPKGTLIYKQLNFFLISNSNNITIANIEFDGKNIGDVVGHLLYCGIIVRNPYRNKGGNIKPLFGKFKVNNCKFVNLKGRAVAVYGADDVVIENNFAKNISYETFELDHMSSGEIVNNEIIDSLLAIQLNDAFNSLVKNNKINNTSFGVMLLSHFQDDWLNINNRIVNNTIKNTSQAIIAKGEHNKNILIQYNHFKNVKLKFKGENRGIKSINNYYE